MACINQTKAIHDDLGLSLCWIIGFMSKSIMKFDKEKAIISFEGLSDKEFLSRLEFLLVKIEDDIVSSLNKLGPLKGILKSSECYLVMEKIKKLNEGLIDSFYSLSFISDRERIKLINRAVAVRVAIADLQQM